MKSIPLFTTACARLSVPAIAADAKGKTVVDVAVEAGTFGTLGTALPAAACPKPHQPLRSSAHVFAASSAR